jgi:hypothetical protein
MPKPAKERKHAMASAVNPKGFARLDFDEIKRVAALTGFDVREQASKKRSCGPGCDYLVQDKRYYTLMLLKHVENLVQAHTRDIADEVLDWLDRARTAASEYVEIERKIHRLPKRNKR